MTFTNSLDPDQDQKNVWSGFKPFWHSDSIPEIIFFLKTQQTEIKALKITKHAKSKM